MGEPLIINSDLISRINFNNINYHLEKEQESSPRKFHIKVITGIAILSSITLLGTEYNNNNKSFDTDTIEIGSNLNKNVNQFNKLMFHGNQYKDNTIYLFPEVITNNVPHSPTKVITDIINIKDISKTEAQTLDKLIRVREKLELTGIIMGIALSVIILSMPLLLRNVYFPTVIPGSIMFLGLPIFVLIRKLERRQKNK